MTRGNLLVLLSLALSLALVATLRTRESPIQPQEHDRVESVSFESVRAPYGVGGLLRFSEEAVEFKVWLLGSKALSMACDGETYWFWVRSHDPRRYHFCRADEVGRAGLNPLFSPTFVRCSSGAEFVWRSHPEDGESSFEDGDYSVSVVFSGGRAVSLSYSVGEEEVVGLRFTEHQKVAGRWLTRRMVVAAEDIGETEIDLGRAEVNSGSAPDARPPDGMKGVRLGVRP